MTNEEKPSTSKEYYKSMMSYSIDILPPIISKTKGSGKRLNCDKEKTIYESHKMLRLCRTCGEHASHDSRNCPKKLNT